MFALRFIYSRKKIEIRQRIKCRSSTFLPRKDGVACRESGRMVRTVKIEHAKKNNAGKE